MQPGQPERRTFDFTATYSSWLNLVERWFAELTTKQLLRISADLEHRFRRKVNADFGGS